MPLSESDFIRLQQELIALKEEHYNLKSVHKKSADGMRHIVKPILRVSRT